MPAYAIAHLQDVDLGPEIVDYIQKIDATLAPFQGCFLIHGASPEIVEGPWPGDEAGHRHRADAELAAGFVCSNFNLTGCPSPR